MFECFKIIKNVGKFADCGTTRDTQFGKLTLIYAENGRGKTTLCSILNSLSTNNAEIITNRKRLGTKDDLQIILNIDSASYIFSNNVWNKKFDNIMVFDDNFVSENVCDGMIVNSDHKKNLCQYIIGKEGVDLLRQIEKSSQEIIEINNESKQLQKLINDVISDNSMSLEEFCALAKVDNITSKINELESIVNATNNKNKIISQGMFALVKHIIINYEDIERIIEKTDDSIHIEVVNLVRNQFRKFEEGYENWVKDGMRIRNDFYKNGEGDICPFCRQNISENQHIHDYEKYFNSALESFKQEIEIVANKFKSDNSDDVRLNFERSIQSNITAYNFWKNHVELAEFSINPVDIVSLWKEVSNDLLGVLRNKYKNPDKKFVLPIDLKTKVQSLNQKFSDAQEVLNVLFNKNSSIEAFKQTLGNSDINELRIKLSRLKLVEKRHQHINNGYCANFLELKSKKQVLEKQKESDRIKLQKFQDSVFYSYNKSINIFLDKLNANFKISKLEPKNIGKGQSSDYGITIDNYDTNIKLDGNRVFQPILSSGDRNSLALSFFLASIENSKELNKKILVIDDPMTSLDEHRQNATLNIICDFYRKVDQTIIFSHNKTFLCEVWNKITDNNKTPLEIIRVNGDCSEIHPWNVNAACVTENDHRHSRVTNYIENQNNENQENVRYDLRLILDCYFRTSYPLIYKPGSLLGKLANELKEKKLLSMDDIVELKELIDYSNQFHHDTNPNYNLVKVNNTELLGYCKKVLKFVQK